MTDQQLSPKEPRTYRFCSIVDAKRMDTYLTEAFHYFSRSFFQHLLKQKQYVEHNGSQAKATTSVKVGDVLAVTLPKLKNLSIVAEDLPLDIIYEDKDLIAINKAAGMVVHPTERGGHYSGTVVNAMLHHCPKEFSGIKGERRPGIVHRLDKDTSGVLVVAKSDEALQNTAIQFQDRTTYKEYLTLVRGRPSVDHGQIDAPLARDPNDRKKIAISGHKDARDSLTEFFVEEVYKGVSLLRVIIHTGRTHQIRVHLASIGHPVVGDTTYGDSAVNHHFKDLGLTRQFLHAHKLGIKHPRTGEDLEFVAELPEELQVVLGKLVESR